MTTKTWNRPTRIAVLVVLVALAALFLWSIGPLFRPLTIGAFVAYLLNPIVDFVVQRLRLTRGLATMIVFACALMLIVAGGVMVASQPAVGIVAARIVDSLDELESIDREIERRFSLQLRLDEMVVDLREQVESSLNVSNVVFILQRLSANAAWTLVTMVATFYLLKDWTRMRRWLIGLAPSAAQRDLQRLYDEIRQIWQRFLRGQLLLMIFVGFLSGLGAFAIGLPGALALGLITGILDIIPTLGPGIAMTIAMVVAWLAGSTWLQVSPAAFTAIVLLVFSLVQLIENVWLRPRIIGSSVRMHPGVVFIAFFTALTLSGILLAILIIPLLGTAMVVGRYLRARILAIEPWAEDGVPSVVDMLLARDDDAGDAGNVGGEGKTSR